jgi:peptidoglycan-associated lipoprotein
MKRTFAAAFAFSALSLAACSSTKQIALKEPGDPDARWLARQAAVEEMMKNFRRVHFEFDSAQITPETRDALAANVDIMRRFDELLLEVEGHCDEQGSTEYNLALGERRANAIRKYMQTAGVDAKRISTISYGEEEPLVAGSDEAAYSQNRRAEFRVRVDPTGEVRSSTEVALFEDADPSKLAQR